MNAHHWKSVPKNKMYLLGNRETFYSALQVLQMLRKLG